MNGKLWHAPKSPGPRKNITQDLQAHSATTSKHTTTTYPRINSKHQTSPTQTCHDSAVGTDYFSFSLSSLIFSSHHCSPFISSLCAGFGLYLVYPYTLTRTVRYWLILGSSYYDLEAVPWLMDLFHDSLCLRSYVIGYASSTISIR